MKQRELDRDAWRRRKSLWVGCVAKEIPSLANSKRWCSPVTGQKTHFFAKTLLLEALSPSRQYSSSIQI